MDMKCKNYLRPSFRNVISLWILLIPLFLFSGKIFASPISSTLTGRTYTDQDGYKITGKVLDAQGEVLPGATVRVKGSSGQGTATDLNGNFTIYVKDNNATLIISFLGMPKKEIPLHKQTNIKVEMEDSTVDLDQVMVVGYGQQKKQSVVGAIVQAKGSDLQRTGGITNMAQALTGLLPGVSTVQVSGQPGVDDPIITIRGQSTWNNSSPLILVDGIERKMSDVDINDVESVSVLKDASATAVFGVKGSEGVILITTKRGKEGRTHLQFSQNFGVKTRAKMNKRLDAYDALAYQNAGIERELPAFENGWGVYTPMQILNRYRYRLTEDDQYIYPNVDWTNAFTKDYGTTQHYNLNISGGTKFAKYFGAFSYTNEGDMLNSGLNTGLNNQPEFSYDRYNYRTNLDFNITKTTVFSVNLAGNLGVLHGSNADFESDLFRAFYDLAPGAFPVRHKDGSWGYYMPNPTIYNPVQRLNTNGIRKTFTSQVATDFTLDQKLDVITKGLGAKGSFSFDNQSSSTSSVSGSSTLQKYIDPYSLEETYSPKEGSNGFDYVMSPGTVNGEYMNVQSVSRRIFYQLQLNYARKFDKHDISALGVFNREEYSSGSMFPRYREDWVGRITYNYDDRYLFEANGAYNGSEKFGKGYRFGFFPSVAVGWVLSNEKFLKYDWLDKLKVRYSIGQTGNDNFDAPRWAYETQWILDVDPTWGSAKTVFGPDNEKSIYNQYVESVVGNPKLQWETSLKQNLGLEASVFHGLFSGTLDIFKDKRDKIFMGASQRSTSDYFGAAAPSANIGKTNTQGFELEIRFQNKTSFGMNYWLNYSYTHAKDEITYMEDPALLPAYQKNAGFQIDQTRSKIITGYMESWDDVYASVKADKDNAYRLPGDAKILDFNADGVIDSYDVAPYAYPDLPQNTYNVMGGLDYKGFSFMVQFYGVFNATRGYDFITHLGTTIPVVPEEYGDYWSTNNLDATWVGPRTNTTSEQANLALYDASYLRLKNVELSYTFSNRSWLKSLQMESMKVLVSGYNLAFWSKLPEEKERGLSEWAGARNYPIGRRANIGLNITF